MKTTKKPGAVMRGEKVGAYTAMGTADDGTVILKPKQGPTSFKPGEARKAISAVKQQLRKTANAS